MEVRAVSVIGDIDIVASDVEVLAVKWLADVAEKLVGEVSISLAQGTIIGAQ